MPTPISPQPSGGLCQNLNPSFGNDHPLITRAAPTAMSHDSDDDDLMDLEDLRFVFSSRKKTRSIKYDHTRINWDEHINRLTNKFEQRFRMPLLCAVSPPIAAISVVSP